jgi:hypothetical protein
MIATPGRSSEDPLPRLGTEGAEAPEFQVLFSRPADFGGRPDSWPNSFRWSGNGTIHIMERGLLIIAKRRSAMGFHTTEQRFVPAAEICDVYREGNSVRVDLRGDLQQRGYFQFWTAAAATAGTIVRLLPTTRTIEYEGPSVISVPAPITSSPHRRRASARTFVMTALVARPEDESLDSVVRTHLLHVARGWEAGLDDYVRGLIDQNYTTVLEAFDRMSAGNEAQHQAWRVIERAER